MLYTHLQHGYTVRAMNVLLTMDDDIYRDILEPLLLNAVL